jgi:DNA-binding LytR/AlgR family response regulator
MPDRLRIVVAEDEPLALERLLRALADMSGIEILGSAENGLEAARLIETLKPDLAILDIQMPGRTGLGVAAGLPLEARPEIIFLTAYDSHAVDAFDVDAADYLLKPLRVDRLRQAIERVRRRRASGPPPQAAAAVEPAPAAAPGPQGFWLQGRSGLFLVPVAEVEWVQAAKDYVLLHTSTRSHILRATMASIEREYGEALMRVHRSALVSPGAVRSLQTTPSGGAALLLGDEVAVQVGPSYLPDVLARFS